VRIERRVSAFCFQTAKTLNRMGNTVRAEEGPPLQAMEVEKGRRAKMLEPLGYFEWDSRPLKVTPTIPWETLKSLAG